MKALFIFFMMILLEFLPMSQSQSSSVATFGVVRSWTLPHAGYPYANKFSPDGKFLMVGIRNYGIYYYNVTSNYTHLGSITSGFGNTNYWCLAMDFTPNGSNFIYSPY